MDFETLKNITAIITPAFLFIMGIGIGAVSYFLKAMHQDINKKFESAEDKVGKLERDLMEFKAVLPRQYVLKDDYIRTISGFEYKLDEFGKKMDTLLSRGGPA